VDIYVVKVPCEGKHIVLSLEVDVASKAELGFG
jgi:hypothetical protein